METIPRILAPRVRHALERQKSVLLLGPRQTGKTTLVEALKPDLLLNFLRPEDATCPARRARPNKTSEKSAKQRQFPRQCSTRGTDSVNSGISASNRVPSSATIW